MRVLSLPRSRRLLVAVAAVFALLLEMALVSPASHADDSSTLTVVGTSDVYDSNLVQAVLKPGFEAAYPQYTLNYVSKGTGAAITYAEAGTASALLVHAPSLENQFVAGGYSKEKYGRAIFWGDYVLLGPASDPAGVMTNDSHNIVGAFQDIAAAGALGNANFVSRGGTPGTTVQEHAIWALTTGVTTCTMSDANGGGTSPSTDTGDCPDTISYPSWYHATGLTQGPNVENGDTCNYPSANDNCYVFTDRGTYQYLLSTGAISNLQIVTRDNDSSAPGGTSLLVNSFHAYAINANKFTGVPGVEINEPAATKFLNWVTSPAGQKLVGNYLATTHDPPFIPDAAPKVTASKQPGKVAAGKTITVTGTVTNVVPGTPVLNGVTVKLMGLPLSNPLAAPTTLATGKTDSTGTYTLKYKTNRSRTYSVVVPKMSRVENALLNPIFGDILASGSKSVGKVTVASSIKLGKVSVHKKTVTISGTIAPTVVGGAAHVSLYAAKSMGALKYVGQKKLSTGTSGFKVKFTLPKGTWKIQLRYVNKNVVVGSSTGSRTVTVS